MVENLGTEEVGLDPCYTGWFTCFNRGDYYEAHDVLEHLWLQDPGTDYAFFKGLIQLAGAFVHLKKQHLRPTHPKDGARLRPATRLFALALKNLEPYAPLHHRLQIPTILQLCRNHIEQIERSFFTQNPWTPEHLPQIRLERLGSE